MERTAVSWGNSKLRIGGLFLILTLSVRVPAEQNPPATAQDRGCSPPNYCARTDRQPVPYPKDPPTLGPVGSIVTDPSFGSRIVRVTDAKTGNGESYSTPSSAEQNSWNSAGTSFYVLGRGGQIILYDFDPATMKPHARGGLRQPFGGEPEFSLVDPNLLYGTDRRADAFAQYDIATGRFTDLYSASKCMKLGGDDHVHGISVSADDNRLATAVGPQQDKNHVVMIYDRKQGCRWYDTQTGEVGGEWGPKGTVLSPERFLVHGMAISRSGKYIFLTRGNPSPGHFWLIWDVDTLKVALCPGKCKGHHVLGYNQMVASAEMGHPMELIIRPLDKLEQTMPLIGSLEPLKGYWYDSHFSWNNVDAEDSTPVCFSTYRPSNKPLQPPDVDGPWENEIDCMSTDPKEPKIWRFAHTFSTAKNGFWSTPRGNVSRDGRFYAFTSDWEDQLGRGLKTDYRTDVFIVELK
jgi:hypothetical protein